MWKLAILGGLNPTISPSNLSGNPSNETTNGNSSEKSETEKKSEEKPSNNTPISEMVSGNAPILGERGTENIGLAVMKDGIYLDDLTALDTLCHTLISGEVNSFLLTMVIMPRMYADFIGYI